MIMNKPMPFQTYEEKMRAALRMPAPDPSDGVTLTTEQGVADPQRTVLIYRIDDLTSTAERKSKEFGNGMGGMMPVMRLSDGTEIQVVRSSGAWPHPVI